MRPNVTLPPRAKGRLPPKCHSWTVPMIRSPARTSVVEEVGHPYGPTDVFGGDFELTIAQSDYGFAGHLSPLLCGRKAVQGGNVHFEPCLISFCWSTVACLVIVSLAVTSPPAIDSVIQVSQVPDLPMVRMRFVFALVVDCCSDRVLTLICAVWDVLSSAPSTT
jgi:hypothetical protein